MNPAQREKMVRVNTRIRADQDAYIKAVSEQLSRSEGEMTRIMLDAYIKSHPLKKKKNG